MSYKTLTVTTDGHIARITLDRPDRLNAMNADFWNELPAAVRERILGAQGQLWTEFMRTPEHVEYMAYPRAAALAEVLWSAQQQRDYAGFQQRLPSHLRRLDHYGVNYRPPGNDALGLRARLEYWLWTAATGLYFWWQD